MQFPRNQGHINLKRLRISKLNAGVRVPSVLLLGRAEAAPRRRLLPRPGGGAVERRDGPRDGAAAGGGRRRSLALRAARGHRRAGDAGREVAKKDSMPEIMQGGCGGQGLGWTDLDLGSSSGWAATFVTYCPGGGLNIPV